MKNKILATFVLFSLGAGSMLMAWPALVQGAGSMMEQLSADVNSARYGEITAKNDTTNSLTLSAENEIWTVNTDSLTKIRLRFMGGGVFSDLKVGDKVTVWGVKNGSVITARFIIDHSVTKQRREIEGKVLSGNSVMGWLVDRKGDRPDVLVKPDANTKYFMQVKGQGKVSATAADVTVGSKIHAKGMLESDSLTLTGVTKIMIKK